MRPFVERLSLNYWTERTFFRCFLFAPRRVSAKRWMEREREGNPCVNEMGKIEERFSFFPLHKKDLKRIEAIWICRVLILRSHRSDLSQFFSAFWIFHDVDSRLRQTWIFSPFSTAKFRSHPTLTPGNISHRRNYSSFQCRTSRRFINLQVHFCRWGRRSTPIGKLSIKIIHGIASHPHSSGPKPFPILHEAPSLPDACHFSCSQHVS